MLTGVRFILPTQMVYLYGVKYGYYFLILNIDNILFTMHILRVQIV